MNHHGWAASFTWYAYCHSSVCPKQLILDSLHRLSRTFEDLFTTRTLFQSCSSALRGSYPATGFISWSRYKARALIGIYNLPHALWLKFLLLTKVDLIEHILRYEYGNDILFPLVDHLLLIGMRNGRFSGERINYKMQENLRDWEAWYVQILAYGNSVRDVVFSGA